MAEIKTHATEASVADYLAAIDDAQRRADCEQISQLMTRVTGEAPRMWGPSIVGFGNYHYRYDSGHSGDACLTGFASRKADISIYLSCASPHQEALLARLGRHKMGKACLYVRRLSEIDLQVLEQLVAASVAELRLRYPATGQTP